MASSSDTSFTRRTVKNSLSGTVAGIAGCLVGHPFDTLKVRLQTQSTTNPTYSGLVDCFTKTLRWEGLGGLYKGVASPIIGQMFFRATLFTSYYQFTSLLAGPERVAGGVRMAHHEYFIAGSLTGVVASFVESPIDLFKTKVQIQIMRAKAGAEIQYRNVFHAGAVIYRNHGLRGVYQGLGATCMRDTPACGIYFGIYEYLKFYFTPPGGSPSDLRAWQVFIAAGSAGFFYWFLTYPTDVIKSAMQSDEIAKADRRFANIADCARRLYREEGGWPRLFRGFAPCLMRSIPANATMLYVVEKCRIYLEPYI